MLMKYSKMYKLLICIVLSAMLFSSCKKPAAIGDSESTAAPPELVDATATAPSAPTYTVTFYADDGSILFIDSVIEGDAAAPPIEPIMSYGNIFTKWDSDFSAVTEDTEIHPECRSVVGKPNVFALAGAYGRTEETVFVPFRLCGDVCLCGFDLTVTYDAEKLSLESVFDEDGGVVYNNETPGRVYINFAGIKDIEADVDICCFKFKVLAEEGEIPVSVAMTSIYAGNEDDSMYIPEYELIPATVYVY